MPLKVLIVTPAPPGSRHGNRHTAMRWARHLRADGHEVDIVVEAAEVPARRSYDLMIALHARKSAASIAAWKSKPDRPLILALTGTDIYGDIHDNAQAQASLKLADRLIVLEEEGMTELNEAQQGKARVIYQSVRPLQRLDPPTSYVLITVIGHLREVKDPFRAALALAHLPAQSRVRVVHLGAALDEAMAQRARNHALADKRYRWLGDLPHGDAMRWLARSHAMVISSRIEGGAHVVSEAIAAGVPVLASRIPGNIGLLGAAYPGYFPFGDDAALAELIMRIETDKRFNLLLSRAVSAQRHLVDAGAERSALNALVKETARGTAAAG